MGGLKYFRDASVSMFITDGVVASIPDALRQRLIALAFQRAKELESQGMEVAPYQFFTIESSEYMGVATKYKIIMEQEQPDYRTEHTVIFEGKCDFNGRIYLFEDWNGKTENVTDLDHYITMLLPEEY